LHGVIKAAWHVTQKIHVVCVHLGLFERERERQIVNLESSVLIILLPRHEALIIAGDFK